LTRTIWLSQPSISVPFTARPLVARSCGSLASRSCVRSGQAGGRVDRPTPRLPLSALRTVAPFSEIPSSARIASNDLSLAVFDGFPVSTGHTLVITKRLTPDWWLCTLDEEHALMALVGEVRELLEQRFQATGFNAGAAAGQAVPHVHVHVIPRYDGAVPTRVAASDM
jgi:diadenosine tetraphosphate (Ap4A) HIT family hydrolase